MGRRAWLLLIMSFTAVFWAAVIYGLYRLWR